MSRTTTILIAVLAVVVLGGGAYLWLNKGSISNPFGQSTANTNTVVHTNTNTSAALNLNLSTADTLKGDKDLDNTVTVAGTSLHITSSLKSSTYESVPAPSGKQFV